jgi:hypothetical protein
MAFVVVEVGSGFRRGVVSKDTREQAEAEAARMPSTTRRGAVRYEVEEVRDQ